MNFQAYIDASGSGLDPNITVISVGGFIASQEVWAAFDKAWQALLNRFGVTALHMREFAHGRGEFTGWNNEKRQLFLNSLADAIRDSKLQAFGCSIPLSLYREFNFSFCLEEAIGTPYTVAAMNAIASASEWRDRNHVEASIVVAIEKGDNQQSDLRRYLRKLNWTDDHYLAGPTFAAKKVAYEQRKALTDFIVTRKTQGREAIVRALPPIEEARPYWRVIERRSFDRVMTSFNVPRRYNHFSENVRRSKRIIDPLCYINGQPMVSGIFGDGYLKDRPDR
jgi:hypothetical protein